MHVEKYSYVKVSNPIVVQFLSENIENEALLKACDSLLESFCIAARNFMDSEKNQTENSKVLLYLQEFEKRQSQVHKDLSARLDDVHVGVENTLSHVCSDLTAKVTGKVSESVLTLHQMVESALRKVDVDIISTTLNESIKSWLEDDFKTSNETLETRIRSQLDEKILAPMLQTHTKLLEHMSSLPSMIATRDVNMDETVKQIEILSNKVDSTNAMMTLKVQNLERALSSQIGDSFRRIQDFKDVTGAHQQRIVDHLKSIPKTTKEVINGVIEDIKNHSKNLKTQIVGLQKHIDEIRCETKGMTTLQTYTRDLVGKVDNLDKQLLAKTIKDNNSTRLKGSEGEDNLHTMLSERLMSRDGYTIERVSGQARSCDIVVKREGYPRVRVESKAHGLTTNEKVRNSEVEKFKRDLMGLNDHGIFVSLYSGIVGIGNFEIQQLPNGKFAIYLANNNYNIEVIIDMINLIYKLHNIISNTIDDGVKVSLETMTRIQSYVKDYNLKIQAAKNHMKDTITLLNEIQLDLIEQVILGEKQQRSTPLDVVDGIKCTDCGKVCKTDRGLMQHAKTCPKTYLHNIKGTSAIH